MQADGKIKVLPEKLINQIAAGEVIDRPSSVVKELVENSIDAGADSITVILKQGGSALIQIMDNGSGMDEQDAIMAFQRHATSKVSSIQDIERVSTLGFRGEALASIASVSRVEMKSVLRDQIEGAHLYLENGVVISMDRTGGNPGTSLSIKNLFYNTPARKKFLRANSTEYRHCLTMMNHFTLSHPEIEFTVIHDDRQIYNLKATTLKERIIDVLGSGVQNDLLELNEVNAVFKVKGYLGNSQYYRKSRGDQYFFVNGRYVNDRTLSAAMMSAYGELIPKGHYPVYILFFEMDPERIDVNVHPTKSEIKFADQQMLFSLVRGAVLRALKKDDVVPNMQSAPAQQLSRPRFKSSIASELRVNPDQTRIDFDAQPQPGESQDPTPPAPSSPFMPAAQEPKAEQDDEKMLWQLHNKYILAQIKSGLVIIDQHAAHERILYEKVKSLMDSQSASSQQLLFPQTIELSPDNFEYLMEILPFLHKIGFAIKGFGGRTIVVEGVPADMRTTNTDRLVQSILDEYKLKQGTEVDIRERVAKSVACRSAIMTGERLSRESMSALIDQLFACDTPYFCPHGRPTVITLTLDELDERFERT
ncbi:MAG: DNA mismatch repair endonuclease MutL [candidate division KSB1 bacterium]|nr:DNA mismatch repair endonuclease MutL [candidate division KSB1 bacterium]